MRSNIAIVTIVFFLLFQSCNSGEKKALEDWKIADNPILSEWALQVDPAAPWPEYPRPDAKRDEWINLNGLWDYAITELNSRPEKWDGKILVPYPVESALSGVKKKVSENENLWYRRTFKLPATWKRKQILLNFEASDWETIVYIDGREAGRHQGGYDPFSINITDFLERKKNHELLICIWDPTDKGSQPRGKQVSEPGGIWYTPTTGIWQTIWLEPVPESYIVSYRSITEIETGTVTFSTDVFNPGDNRIKITLLRENNVISSVSGSCNDKLIISIPDPKVWTPENPFLYDVLLELTEGDKIIDKVSGFTGLRKISIGKTADGFNRILLNNKFVYQNGPLDQGFWPDGIYTPITEKAMILDLEMIKKMGFNMLRKHVKVENRIFYHWCDKLGILVWQDMPSGDKYISGDQPDIDKSKESSEQFEYELKRMIETKYNHPSIVMWVPFNEGWGQFETERITNLIKDYDSTRIVNSSSGWTDRGTGDVNDIHHYPDPAVPSAEEKRAIVLGEFGGLGLPVPEHTWEQKNWGYRNMEDSVQLLAKYESYYDQVYRFVKENGLSATIYTQTTDVETETNGLMTYDRKINKMGIENVYKANNNLIPPYLDSPLRIFTDTYTISLSNYRPGGKIFYTTDGSEPQADLQQFTDPVIITETTVIKAFTQWDEIRSRTATMTIEKKKAVPAIEVYDLKPGLIANVFYGEYSKMPEFHTLRPAFSKTVTEISHKLAKRDSFFAIEYEGYLLIPADGVYGLSLISDDGSKLFLNGTEIITNDGIHGLREEGGYYPLGKGHHKIRIEYFQREGGVGLKLLLEVPGHQKSNIPEPWLLH
ncbi:MAG: chitobiase/beta-hexosaminidase C-terminal domain-containing protein [Bacteroidetes bacterium]|nr:chitobiase/beta-hexosaminidase C-terminal domain-containing protein [Bacteroidota bacterium]